MIQSLRRIARVSLRVSATLAALALLASTASAQDGFGQDGFGPTFGSNKITSELSSLTERSDVDGYVADLIAGETLSVTVSTTKGSAARFTVNVVDPDGLDRTIEGKVKAKANKKSAKFSIKNLKVDKTGLWTVRISGIDDTEGGYQAAFKIASAPKVTAKKQDLGGAGPTTRVHSIGGIDGGTLDVKVKWGKKDTPVELLDVRGPDGTVEGIFGEDDEALRLKSRDFSLKKHPIRKGTGTYEVEVGSTGASRYTITMKVAAPPRPGGKVTITAVNDPHLDTQAVPVRSAAGQPVRITGRNFSISPTPTVRFGPFTAPVTAVGGARNFLDVIVPPGADGTIQPVIVINPDGQSAAHDDYIIYVAEAVIEDVVITDGPVLGETQVLATGGARLEVRGRNFRPVDTATLGGTAIGRIDLTSTSFSVVVPPGGPGLIDLVLTDEFGRTQTVSGVVRRVGMADATSDTSPGRTTLDDLSAFDAALGDLDRDGRVDDIVIVTYNRNSRLYPEYYLNPGPGSYYLENEDNPLGTGAYPRDVYTRLLVGDGGTGVLVDRTSNLPSNGADARGVDDFNALAVALGDLDGERGDEIVLGGSGGKTDGTADFDQVRIFTNDGSGGFRLAETIAPRSPITTDSVVAFDETYVPIDPDNPPPEPEEGEDPVDPVGIWAIAGPRSAPRVTTTVAIGDLDGDGDAEIVTGAPGFGYRYINIDPSPVDYTQDPIYISSGSITYVRTGYYFSGTRVFDNDLENSNGFADVTEAVMPSVGTVAEPGAVAFPARHLLLGDVDLDDDLDVIVTWSNPASMIPASADGSYGAYLPYTYGRFAYQYDADTADPVVATRVLLNDGEGNLSDATATWMPAASGVEFWQAHRIALEDLDGDGDLDLILQHRRALNEWREEDAAYDRSSLRILRNDGDAFVDVTATALPELPGGSGGVLRGRAIAVADLDLDGNVEIVIGTSTAFTDDDEVALPSTRVLWGQGEMRWEFADDFVVPTSVDTGEVHALLIGDLDVDGVPSILLFGERIPMTSPGGALNPALFRVQDWLR